MLMITKICFKNRRLFKQNFLLVEIRSIHLPLSFKNVLVSNKSNMLNDYINYVNAGKFGSILKSSKKI